jgi:hypothetical protein
MNSEDARAEYKALRDTIRERGTRRVVLFWMALAVWAALLLTSAAGGATPYASLVSLVPLVAGFEAVYALQVGVERIGRYLQVFYEDAGTLPAWEGTAMAYGREPTGDGVDPLFWRIFAVATLLNLLPALPGRQPAFIAVALLAHGLFAVRVLKAHRYARGQRVRDLARFRQLSTDQESSKIES